MSWTEVKIGEVATIERKSVQPNSIKDGSIYVGLENIKTGGSFLNVAPVINGELASSKFVFTKNHVLFGKLRPYLAKVALPNFQGICSTDILPILPSSKLDASYLRYVLLQQKMVDKANSLATGANLPRISPKALCELKIPLPPLVEQKRIAAILDKAADIKAKREQAIAKLDELAQSTFMEMFGEQISTSTKTVNDFFEVNVNRYETNLKDSDSVSFVPMSAVSEISKTIELEETRAYSDVRKGYTPIRRGDLIVAKITPCYENGKQAIATVSTQFAYGSTEFHTFRSSNKDLVTLLHYYLQTKKVMREGAANMKGAAGQRRVPDSFFKSLPFSLPATNELSKFGAVIASLNKRRAEQIRQLAVIENTIQSLQHQAFTTGFNA